MELSQSLSYVRSSLRVPHISNVSFGRKCHSQFGRSEASVSRSHFKRLFMPLPGLGKAFNRRTQQSTFEFWLPRDRDQMSNRSVQPPCGGGRAASLRGRKGNRLGSRPPRHPAQLRRRFYEGLVFEVCAPWDFLVFHPVSNPQRCSPSPWISCPAAWEGSSVPAMAASDRKGVVGDATRAWCFPRELLKKTDLRQ